MSVFIVTSGWLRRILFVAGSVFLAGSITLSPAAAKITPQDIDAAIGQQTPKQPTPIVKLSTPQAPAASTAMHAPALDTSDKGKIPEIPRGTVTLQDENKVDDDTLSTILRASVTKAETQAINLETVLKLAATQNLPMAQNALAARIQRNNYHRSLSDMLPDITGGYSQSKFTGGMQILGNQVMQIERTQFMPQITATWTIRPGGRDLFTALAARRRYAGSKSLLENTTQEQLAGAAIDYYNLLESQIQVENVKIGIEETKSQVNLNESRFNAGVGTKLDVMRAQSLLVQKERELINAETQKSKAEQALLTRLNLDSDVALNIDGALAQPHLLVSPLYKTEELVAMAKANNPTVAQAEAEIKALKAEAYAAISRIVPAVTLQTYLQGTGSQLSQLNQGKYIGLSISTELFQKLGTSIPLEYRGKQLQIKQQEIALKNLHRTIENKVIQAYLEARQNAKAILTTQQELKVAEEAYRLAWGRYRAGLGINVDVLDAQTALSTARTNIAQATLAFNRAQVSLLQAIGKVTKDTLLNGLASNVSNTTLPTTTATAP